MPCLKVKNVFTGYVPEVFYSTELTHTHIYINTNENGENASLIETRPFGKQILLNCDLNYYFQFLRSLSYNTKKTSYFANFPIQFL